MKHSKSLASAAPVSIVKDNCKDDVPQTRFTAKTIYGKDATTMYRKTMC
jgi:hypothetical protein